MWARIFLESAVSMGYIFLARLYQPQKKGTFVQKTHSLEKHTLHRPHHRTLFV